MSRDFHGFWNRSQLGRERIENSPHFQEAIDNRREMWGGRPIITRDAPINGGVFLGGNEREAIVVDDTRENGYYKRARQSVQKTIDAYTRNGYNTKVQLQAIYDVTRRVLPYNKERVTELLNDQLGENWGDKKIALEYFMKIHAGVCRHQVLLAGYLIEYLIKKGDLQGTVSIDRNNIPYFGAHTWIRYTNRKHVVFIMDLAQGYFGPLEGSEKKSRWIYRRPEDPEPLPADPLR